MLLYLVMQSSVEDVEGHMGVLAELRSNELSLEVQSVLAGALTAFASVLGAILETSAKASGRQNLALYLALVAIIGAGAAFAKLWAISKLPRETTYLTSLVASLRRLAHARD